MEFSLSGWTGTSSPKNLAHRTLNARAASGSAGTLAGEKFRGQLAGKGAGAPSQTQASAQRLGGTQSSGKLSGSVSSKTLCSILQFMG